MKIVRSCGAAVCTLWVDFFFIIVIPSHTHSLGARFGRSRGFCLFVPLTSLLFTALTGEERTMRKAVREGTLTDEKESKHPPSEQGLVAGAGKHRIGDGSSGKRGRRWRTGLRACWKRAGRCRLSPSLSSPFLLFADDGWLSCLRVALISNHTGG